MSPRLSRSLVVVLGALSAFGPLSTDMYLPSLPDIGYNLGTSASAVQLTLTASTVGLGAGQLVAGPLSDSLGRRRPLMAGLVMFAVFSLACAVAPTLPLLVLFRLLQALGGSAGLVISRAVARDLRSGPDLARLFALLMAVNGTAPIVAPVIGGQLVRFTSWRGVFVVLAVIGAALLAAASRVVPETLPEGRRSGRSLGSAFASYRRLLHDRVFVLHVTTGAFAFATLFSYISGSPFVLETLHGLSPQLFGVVFAVNSVGLVLSTQVSRLLPTTSALVAGLGVSAVGATIVLVSVVAGLGLPVLLAGFFVLVSGYGITAPHVTARALADHPEAAGSASAVLGAGQFLIGGLIGPLVGLAGGRSALPLALVLTALALAALVTGALGVRGTRLASASPAAETA